MGRQRKVTTPEEVRRLGLKEVLRKERKRERDRERANCRYLLGKSYQPGEPILADLKECLKLLHELDHNPRRLY